MGSMLYYFGQGHYDKEYGELWAKCVPKSGQADTVQGELVRAIGRLASEAYRNGNLNWDEGYRILVKFLHMHLPDSTVFNPPEVIQIEEDLSVIGDMGNDSGPLDFGGGEDAYDRITDRVVEWCAKHPEAIPLPRNPKLKR
jgi:hypothetical protein